MGEIPSFGAQGGYIIWPGYHFKADYCADRNKMCLILVA